MVWIDNARILAIFAVVFLHCASGLVTGIEPFNSTHWWIGNFYTSLVRWCVPVFVMVSGALLLDPNKTESLREFYTKRAARVLIPLLFWTLFFSVWQVKGAILRGEAIPWLYLGRKIVEGGSFYHMWFLYMIIGLYLFTPFFRKIVNHTSDGELTFLLIVLFGMSMLSFVFVETCTNNAHLITNRFLLYLPYFFAGHVIRTTQFKPNRIPIIVVFLTSVVLTSLGCYWFTKTSGLEQGMYFHGNLSITVIPMSLSIMFLLKELSSPIVNLKTSKYIASLSLGIYLVHPAIIDGLDAYGISARTYNPVFAVPIVFVLVSGLSLIVVHSLYMVPYVKRIV
jgi:surface polysaccharide O-acyltransferase-like enzyme